MATVDTKNRFPGVNPILNSLLQQPDGAWDSFHARFIGELAATLDVHLPAGYYAVEEKSLQILHTPDLPFQRTRPDVTIYQTTPALNPLKPAGAATPTLSLPIVDTLPEDEIYSAVVIYFAEGGQVPGIPITRLEVLSAGNMPFGGHHESYMSKRRLTLQSGVNLVEIDLLHQSPPCLPILPNYAQHESDAYPYWILVSRPQPNLITGFTDVYGVGVLDRLPWVAVPLQLEQTLTVDLQAIYNATFESRRLFGLLVDYDTLLQHISHYRPNDQTALQHFRL
jgi:hypothetical protein